MTKITQADKEVHAATALFKRREEEFRLAKEDKEKKEKKKKMLTEHLRLIIYENEKKKEEKLFFLMVSVCMKGRKGCGERGEYFLSGGESTAGVNVCACCVLVRGSRIICAQHVART